MCCRWAEPCRQPSVPPGSGLWPSARSLSTSMPMKTSMSSILIFIFVPPLAAWVQDQPVDDRFRTHACERPLARRWRTGTAGRSGGCGGKGPGVVPTCTS